MVLCCIEQVFRSSEKALITKAEFDALRSSTISFVTPIEESVVNCIGPKCRVGNPNFRSSDVRSVFDIPQSV